MIELTVALSVTSILLVAIGSAMVLTSRAIPDGTGPASVAVEAGDGLSRLARELQHAEYVAERTAGAITFTVADRTGNGSPERIRYAWSGAPGDPLTRQFNDGDPVAMIAEVAELSFTYHEHETSHAYAGPAVEGSEQVLSVSPSGDSATASVRSSQSLGQYIYPQLPADALGWRPTRVQFRASRPWLSSGSFHVQLRHADLDDKPDEPASDRVIVQETLGVSLLSLSLSWREAEFSDPPMVLPGVPVALAFVHNSGSSPIAYVEYREDTNVGGMSFSDGSGNWTLLTDRTVRHRLQGRVTTPGPTQQFERRFLTAVTAELRTTEPNATAVTSEIELVNRPELLQGFWRADFRHDPTRIDVNADQLPDWVADEAFDTGSLSGGVWHADRTLAAYPTGPLTTPLRFRVRMRHASADGGAAVAWLYFDRADGTIGNLLPLVQRQSDGTQMLLLYSQRDDGSWRVLARVNDLPADFVDLRLLIDPGPETVHLQVNGKGEGTHHYELRSASSGNGLVALGHSGSNVEFQYAELAVAETP